MKDRAARITTATVMVAFVLIAWSRYMGSSGDDLSSSYMACRLISDGSTEAIYAHDPVLFHVVDHMEWTEAAQAASFDGFLHPYVQTPLWAQAIAPLCTAMDFGQFNALFSLLALISLAATAWMVGRFYVGGHHVAWLVAGLLVWLWFSLPFQYAMFLTQTHAIFIALSVAGLLLAERGRQLGAGAILAVAVTVKITPALLGIYWLAAGRYRAAASMLGVSAALVVLTLWTGGEMFGEYLQTLSRVSDTLLVSFNNHSVAALMMSPHYPGEIGNWRILSLPTWLKWGSMLAGVSLVTLAGVARRYGGSEAATASIALLALTMFTPIAWSHYYIVLLVPLAWMIADRRLWVAAVAVALISCIPHSEFRTLVYASTIALAACAVRLLMDRRATLLGSSQDPRSVRNSGPTGSQR